MHSIALVNDKVYQMMCLDQRFKSSQFFAAIFTHLKSAVQFNDLSHCVQ